MFDLYTAATPNGQKISIALEEMALPYEVHRIALGKGEQKSPEFLARNPNGTIPVLHDREADWTIFESGAILIWLAETSGFFLPSERKARSLVIQWLMFQMGGVGPMQGQAGWFRSNAPENAEGYRRYHDETRRLYAVYDQRLAEHEWLAGALSIADFATFPWVNSRYAGVSTEGFPNVERWLAQMTARPAVQRGLAVPGRG